MNFQTSTYGPEGIYVEYKEVLPSPLRLAKALISFSNTKGGRIIIGVEDKTGVIRGIDACVDVEEYIMNVASENCKPIISPIVEHHSFEKKVYVVVDVPAGSLKPYHLRHKPVNESTYVRVGSTNRLADAVHIRRLMRESANESFDRLLIPRTSSADLDLSKIARYQELKHTRLGTPKEKITDAYLKKIGVKAEASAGSPVTLGGLLVFGNSAQSLACLSRAVIKAGRFSGKEMGVIADHDILEGTIDEQVEKAFQFIKKHMFTSGSIIGLQREDRPNYPHAAIREIATNAVIHRDYSRAESEAIMLKIFDDRLEVESPGLLPIGVTVSNLGNVQNTRNPLIAKFMFDMNYFDEWGQGINRIIQACRDNGNLPPLFEELDSTFKVTVYSRPSRLPYRLRDRRRLLLEHLRRAGEIQSSEYQSITHVGAAQAAKDFQAFIGEGLIQRRGKGRSTRYALTRD